MQRYKKYIFPLLSIFILFFLFYIVFITFDFFPHKYYHIVETNENQVVLETGILGNQTTLTVPDHDFELVLAIINYELRNFDIYLTGIAFMLALLIALIGVLLH